jgi:hypothetical protein
MPPSHQAVAAASTTRVCHGRKRRFLDHQVGQVSWPTPWNVGVKYLVSLGGELQVEPGGL